METKQKYDFIQQTFDVPFLKFFDPLSSSLFNKPIMDIFKFEEWLCEKHGENKNLSLNEIIQKHYGISIAEKFKDLIVRGGE